MSGRKLGHSPLPRFRERLDFLATYLKRPVLHGELALDLGCSLEQVTREMEPLIEGGVYRKLSEDELRELCMDVRVLAYASGTFL